MAGGHAVVKAMTVIPAPQAARRSAAFCYAILNGFASTLASYATEARAMLRPGEDDSAKGERGRLVEDGNHDELIRTGGRYATLHRLQAGLHEVG